jgi:hypothetical protein
MKPLSPSSFSGSRFAAVSRLRTLGRIVPPDLRSAIRAPQPISSAVDSVALNYLLAPGRAPMPGDLAESNRAGQAVAAADRIREGPHYPSKRTGWPVASAAGLCHGTKSLRDSPLRREAFLRARRAG